MPESVVGGIVPSGNGINPVQHSRPGTVGRLGEALVSALGASGKLAAKAASLAGKDGANSSEPERGALGRTCRVLLWKACALFNTGQQRFNPLPVPLWGGRSGERLSCQCPPSMAFTLHSPTSSRLLQRFKQKWINFLNSLYFFPVADMLNCSFLSRQPNYSAATSPEFKRCL